VEILEQMGVMPEFMKQEGPAGAALECSSPAPVSPPPAPIVSPPFEDNLKNGEEESVDQYMARLLQRMRGLSASEPAIASSPEPPDGDSQPDLGGAGQAAEAAGPEPASEDVEEGSARSAAAASRAVAAERTMDLSALREVANLSARHALHRHERRQVTRTALGQFALGVAALVVAGLLLGRWWLGLDSLRALYASGGCLLLGVLWCLYFPLVTAYAARGRQPAAAAPAKPPTPSLIPDPLWEGNIASPVEHGPRAFPRRYFETPPDEQGQRIADGGSGMTDGG
jgi:hypothetical protein